MVVSDRLFKLRSHMATLGVDACIITSADPHLSEYPADHWKFREWISGFTGSAGTVVVTNEEAGLWTDSRYFIQAEHELEDSGIDLYKSGEAGVSDYKDWLAGNLASGSVVGVNGKTMTLTERRLLSENLKSADIRLDARLFIEEDIWEGRPSMPDDGIFELGIEYTGLSRAGKLNAVREEMKKQDVTHYIATTLDEVAWFLNFRGQDVQYNPVFHAYIVISHNQVSLFIDPHKLTSVIGQQLSKEDVKIFLYDDFYLFVKDMPPLAKVLIDPTRCNSIVHNFLPAQTIKIENTSIITNLKARKNTVEIENFKKALLKDGVAMVNFLHWLDTAIAKETVTEYTAAQKLTAFRAEQNNYRGNSFNTISGYGKNGAIVHYAVKEESAARLEPRGLFLIDSGGQYNEGTTDITRTVVLGELTEEEKTDFTLVLKGHIGLDTAVFPEGTRGVHLDILARQAMWKRGINYGHGTGHGIGHFLCVHEGPQSIRPQDNGVEMAPGMISSNEPGIYRPGKHGVRHETLMMTCDDQETEFGRFMMFETLTLCPFDTRAIHINLINEPERNWLNSYHQKVFDQISPLLNKKVKEWLKTRTQMI